MSLLEKRYPVCHAGSIPTVAGEAWLVTIAAREAWLTDASDVEVEISTGGCPSRAV